MTPSFGDTHAPVAGLSLDSSSKGSPTQMTQPNQLTSITAVAVTLLSPLASAAGIYSQAVGYTEGAPDNPIPRSEITVWETGVASYNPAPGVSGSFSNPTTGIASLGDLYNPLNRPAGWSPATHGFIGENAPGSITLTFASPIYNGTGADFAVFENGILMNTASPHLLFAEFAFVEVSSDGVNFARFPSISTNTSSTGGFGPAFTYFDVTNIHNLAGKHAANWGTPFDLDDLTNHNLVLDGILNLDSVTHVRLVDVAGSGSILDGEGNEIPGIAKDSLGNPILDNWVTTGSGGFDYLGLPTGAIGVLNTIPEPSITLIAALLGGWSLTSRRRR